MNNRINIQQTEPASYQALLSLEGALAKTNLSKTHKELIKIRASQINGCAFCINMHTTDARKNGETEQRIYLLNAWRETELFTQEERVVLAMTEEITLIANGGLSDGTYKKASALFDEQYIAQLIMMIVLNMTTHIFLVKVFRRNGVVVSEEAGAYGPKIKCSLPYKRVTDLVKQYYKNIQLKLHLDCTTLLGQGDLCLLL